MRLRIILLAVGLCFLLVAGYLLYLATAESLYTKRGTPAFWFAISRVIRETPTPGALEPPLYYSSAGDGPKLPESAVHFRTSAPAAEVERSLQQFVLTLGYRRRAEDNAYVKGRSILSWEITPALGGLQVTVREQQ
ncbi:MAG: hypothetical protein NZV14_17540 [Bryobacteraceae bacterium]|nr:hypothetical protein [Bryobacteraceae bacterium]MDW8379966.1 hypothetical protein [Bryobacterales bacterium]